MDRRERKGTAELPRLPPARDGSPDRRRRPRASAHDAIRAAEGGSAGTRWGMTDRVLVFDTTLRDGEQAPGCSMTAREKLEVARQLARLGVDIIEGGFPASSE